MVHALSKTEFNALVTETCCADRELRHEIEREKDYDIYRDSLDAAYDLFREHFLTVRESFGLTERGY